MIITFQAACVSVSFSRNRASHGIRWNYSVLPLSTLRSRAASARAYSVNRAH